MTINELLEEIQELYNQKTFSLIHELLEEKKFTETLNFFKSFTNIKERKTSISLKSLKNKLFNEFNSRHEHSNSYSKRAKNQDNILSYLREARALLREEQEEGKGSRELSIVLTNIDTALLFRAKDSSFFTNTSYKEQKTATDYLERAEAELMLLDCKTNFTTEVERFILIAKLWLETHYNVYSEPN